MTKTINIGTTKSAELVDITSRVQAVVRESGVQSGLCVVCVTHTTAALTINENADPSVCRDILTTLSEIVPESDRHTHLEGNSDAHIKASMMGFSVTLIVEDGGLLLGTWQGVYLTEFDGPRSRQILVKVLSESA